MPFVLEQLSQGLTVVGKIDPVSQANGAGSGLISGIDMSKIQRLLFVLQIGSVGGAGTVDAKIQESASSGSGYADCSSSAVGPISITQVTASNKVVTLEIRADQLSAGKRYVQLFVTIGGNAVLIAGLALGAEAEYKPATKSYTDICAQRLVL
jgi:hypothetical protein